MRWSAGFVWVGVVLLNGAAVRGDLVPVSQARSVQVAATESYTQDGVPGSRIDRDSKAAADFLPFLVSLTADAGLGSSAGDQTSQIAPLLVTVSGHIMTRGSLSPPQDQHFNGSGSGTGSSSFSLTFD